MKKMIEDNELTKAISKISQRAEREPDIEIIYKTYVEIGIVPQLINNNNQIIYGRRGTGKTHVFKYLTKEVEEEGDLAIYIDALRLGSSHQFTDTSVPIHKRCLSLFKDIIVEIFEKTTNYSLENPPQEIDKLWALLDELANSLNHQDSVRIEPSKGNEESTTIKKGESGSIKTDVFKPKLGGKLGYEESKIDQEKADKTIKHIFGENKIIFPDVSKTLDQILRIIDCNIYLLIDEWSSIPMDIQPFLAEFLKKSFFHSPNLITKIAALEYRSNFTIPKEKNNYIGFELGSDISTNIDIDEYYVYDKNPDKITSNFQAILIRHLTNQLPENYLAEKGINSDSKIIQALFTNTNVFQELVRASEGVVRDFLNIFYLCFIDARRKGKDRIDKKTILEAARNWFERDKSQNLDEHLEDLLRKIIKEVIGKKKARSFLIERKLEKHDSIQRLFDSRVIHIVKRGYADKDNPGIRYSIYTLDYGTYVDLINTSKEPQLDLELNSESKDIVVPFDDNRSIRRVILKEKFLTNE